MKREKRQDYIAIAVLDKKNYTFTFYYDDKAYEHSLEGSPFFVKDGSELIYHLYCLGRVADFHIKRVVFDKSFRNYQGLVSTSRWFENFIDLEVVEGLENLDTSNVTNMSSMFYGCSSLEKVCKLNSFDTSNVKSATGLFSGCKSLKALDLSSWNTRSFANIENIFKNCDKLEYLNLSNWRMNSLNNLFDDLSTVLNGCNNLRTLVLNKWKPEDFSLIYIAYHKRPNFLKLDFQTDISLIEALKTGVVEKLICKQTEENYPKHTKLEFRKEDKNDYLAKQSEDDENTKSDFLKEKKESSIRFDDYQINAKCVNSVVEKEFNKKQHKTVKQTNKKVEPKSIKKQRKSVEQTNKKVRSQNNKKEQIVDFGNQTKVNSFSYCEKIKLKKDSNLEKTPAHRNFEKKYSLSSKRKYDRNSKLFLYRICAVKDFVLADGTKVCKGETGGWVSGEHNLSHEGSCWIADEAKVSGHARVLNDAIIRDSAIVSGSAQVKDSAIVRNSAVVKDCATVNNNAFVLNSVRISKNARVGGSSRICGQAEITDDAVIDDRVVVRDRAKISGNARVYGTAFVYGNACLSFGNYGCGQIIVPTNSSHFIIDKDRFVIRGEVLCVRSLI